MQGIIYICSVLAQGDYKHRHGCVAKIIHPHLAVNYKLIENFEQYYSVNQRGSWKMIMKHFK
jgi:hypothetical protein